MAYHGGVAASWTWRPGRPSFGWSSLTPTELEVVELASIGLTNTKIAERLLMGRATVKTHLSNSYTKLGISNRTELAAERENTCRFRDESTRGRQRSRGRLTR